MVNFIKRVVVLLGGNSLERDVSLVSGEECAKAISGSGYEVFKVDITGDFIKELENLKPDVVFNALHGRWGEDGAIQGVSPTSGVRRCQGALSNEPKPT